MILYSLTLAYTVNDSESQAHHMWQQLPLKTHTTHPKDLCEGWPYKKH